MISNLEKMEIASVIRSTIRKAMEEERETYVTGEELCRKFQMFTAGWLKDYGHLLPRAKAIVIFKDTGKEHKTGYVYPVNKIRHLIRDNKIVLEYKEKDENNVN